MTLRVFAASLGILLILGLTDGTRAQEAETQSDRTPNTNANANADTPQDQPSTSADAPADEKDAKPKKVRLEKATFGGGCFWCLEAVYEMVPGVKSVVSGYAGGTVPNPTYEMVHTGLTGHAEVVQITYDAEIVPYEDLLEIFWACHDPTTLNRQGPDVGTQYRSIIFFHDDTQKQAALKSYKALTAAHVFARPIVTQLAPLTKFYPAERYHQNYYRNNRNAPYCQMTIRPKLVKLIHKFSKKAPAERSSTPKSR